MSDIPQRALNMRAAWVRVGTTSISKRVGTGYEYPSREGVLRRVFFSSPKENIRDDISKI
jgi:hypothetical protein